MMKTSSPETEIKSFMVESRNEAVGVSPLSSGGPIGAYIWKRIFLKARREPSNQIWRAFNGAFYARQ